MNLNILSKIVLISATILFLGIGANTLIDSIVFTTEYSRALQSKALAIGQSLKSQLDRLLRLRIPIQNLVGFEEQCQDLLIRHKDISYAMIVDLDGKILFHNDPSNHGQILSNPAILRDIRSQKNVLKVYSDEGEQFYDVIMPVLGRYDEHVAAVRIGFPTKLVSKKTGRMVAYSTGVAFVFLGFAILLLIISLNVWVTKPLSRLIMVIHDIREKGTDSAQLIEIDSNDEIGQLGSAFNQMVFDLKGSHEKIRHHTEELEAKVQERTAELKSINEQLKLELTERKRAEEALRDSEERYRSLSEVTIEGIAFHDKGVLVDINTAFAKMFEYEVEELIGKNAIDIVILPEYRNAVREKVATGFNKPYEIMAQRKDGTIIPVEVEAREAHYKGKILRVASLRDMSARKLAEEEQKKLQDQLQRAQKMEVVGTLAGGVAHDLNNILSGLVSYPELLLMEIPEDSPLRKPILTIQKSGEKAAAIVQDLLTLARRGVSVTEVVNLNHIIYEYLKSPEHKKLKSFHPNVHVETNLETDLLNILGSPVHLSKTVMNLVSNAAEAMPEGGKIFISTENRYIDKPIRGYDDVEEGDYITLTVSDTGIGMSPEDMERIFEPFYTKKVMGRSGTGLGMAVVWGTVKDHKGYIDMQSSIGKGTTFTLYFPVTRKELPKDESLLSMEDYIGKGESILVVDDVVEQRDLAFVMLKRLGYSVTTVSSGEEAVEYMKNNSADLLILDMIMDPGIDGLETYRQILELHPGQRAIIASGFSETDRVKEAQRLGVGAYVKKPYLLEKIGLAVRGELER